MKKKLLLPLAFLLATGFVACKQCTNCSYEFDYNKYDPEGVLIESGTMQDNNEPEFCGKKSEVDDKEIAYNDETTALIDSLTLGGYEILVVQSGCERK